MNYFELFDLPVSLNIEKDLVRKKYFELSKKYHPDHFISSTIDEQQNSLDTSAMLNKAFKTFNNKDETIRYVLSLKGLLQEEEKYTLPPGFLMQMMEINEELAELQFDNDVNKKNQVHHQLVELEKELYKPVADIVENYKEGVTTEKELLQVKDYYFKKKYLKRLYQQLNGKL